MINIAVLGYGTVGSGVVEVINTNHESINKRAGDEINIKYVLDLRDFPGDPVEKVLVHDYEVIVNDPEVDIDSLKYMFQEKKANDGTVSGEAYKACIQDIKEKSKSETMIYKTAQQNAEITIKGFVEPFVRYAETSEDYYKVKIITAEENAK